jgi:hypothetical protein
VRIVYLQVAAEVDEAGRHQVRLGTWTPGETTAPVLADAGTVPVGASPDIADGAALYALLAGDDRGDRLEDAGSVVLDIRAEGLARLPWEASRRPDDSAHPPYAFLDRRRPWSRGRWDRYEDVVVSLGPLRVLVVVCDPTDSKLRTDDELDGLHRAAAQPGRIHLEVLDAPASWAVLRAEVEKRAPHVIHLIGHTRQMDTDAVIEFAYLDGDRRRTWELSAEVLRQNWPRGPRLAVLSACRTQSEEATGVRSLTAALRAQVPAVIGMAGDIRSTAAVEFARAMYERLAQGCPVDAATAAGRQAIFDADPTQPDWRYPVLETRSAAGLVLPVRWGVDPDEEQAIRGIGEFAKLSHFVDRSELRRRTWWALDAEGLPGGHPERPAVLITGPRQYGKTWLAQWSMLTYSLRGRRRQYVDLTGTSRDWLDTLRALRDGVDGCRLAGPMPATAFGPFTTRLNWLVQRPESVGMPGWNAVGEPDELRRFDPDTGQAVARIDKIFEDFRRALVSSSGEQPLILAIDGIEEIDQASWRDHVLPGLIRPLVAGLPGIRLLLIMPDDLVEKRLDEDLVPQLERIEVGGFPKAELLRIMREYGVRSDWPLAVTTYAYQLVHEISGDFVMPATLGEIAKTVRMARTRGR